MGRQRLPENEGRADDDDKAQRESGKGKDEEALNRWDKEKVDDDETGRERGRRRERTRTRTTTRTVNQDDDETGREREGTRTGTTTRRDEKEVFLKKAFLSYSSLVREGPCREEDDDEKGREGGVPKEGGPQLQ